jgi:FkbM family methyltransferase
MSFSQYDEETYILRAVEGITNGKLLDIGAWDPERFSNSRRLIMRGWDAVLIEPSPIPLRNLVAYYHESENVHVIGTAVGLEAGFMELALSDDAVSTASEDHYERWKHDAKFYGAALFPVITLEQISLRFGGFDFVNIDTETSSVDLCRHMVDALKWEARCVCVEHDDRMPELCQFMTGAGYLLIYSNGTNAVFQHGQ